MPNSIGHKRNHKRYTPPPDSSCHRFVKAEGTINKAAASMGAIRKLSKATATVGKPMPVTPLTSPASTNTSEIKAIPIQLPVAANVMIFSMTPILPCVTDAENLEYTEDDYGISEATSNEGHPMRFDLTDLRLFLHIAGSGSITAEIGRAS